MSNGRMNPSGRGVRSQDKVSVANFRRTSRSRIKKRRSVFEILEARHLLDASLSTNVLQPLDTTNDTTVSALDALVIINDLARREHGVIDLNIAAKFSLDANCSGSLTALDALLVINGLSRQGQLATWSFDATMEPNGIAGQILRRGCQPHLLEGDSFGTRLATRVTIPSNDAAIELSFDTPEFDVTSAHQIRDAFEIAVLDRDGNPIVLPLSGTRDAAFNWTEGYAPVMARGVGLKSASGMSTITVNLSGVTAGEQVQIFARLLNNDQDDQTGVTLGRVKIVSANANPEGEGLVAPAQVLRAHPIDESALEILSGSVSAEYGRTSARDGESILVTELSLRNEANYEINGPLVAVIDRLSDPTVSVLHPDGVLQDGRPYFILSGAANAVMLAPGDTTSFREIAFFNPLGHQFQYQVETYGQVVRAPEKFLSTPLIQTEAGREYRYVAIASHPDDLPITYQRLIGPESLTIDSQSGVATWLPDANDIGTHQVVIRATAPGGLYVDQAFTLEVVADLQNRPPLFVSLPKTEATVAGSFAVVTLPTGNSPSGLAVGDFGSGNLSLVAINQGDQTLSLVRDIGGTQGAAPQTIDVGEPASSGSVLRVGIGMDLGLPEIRSPQDRNRLDGFASGDINGDGIPDVVSSIRWRYRDLQFNDQRFRNLKVSLGHGDGTFDEAQTLSIPGAVTDPDLDNAVSSLFIMDLDGDGLQDILALDDLTSSLIFYHGRGDGSFDSAVASVTSTAINQIKVADLNGDGTPDLLAERSTNNAFGVLIGNGDGTFGDYTEFASHSGGATYERAFSLGDVDGDSDLDFVSGDWNRRVINVYLNDGAANFSASTELIAQQPHQPAGTTSNVSAITIGDFDGDGDGDIVFGTLTDGKSGGGVGIYFGDGSGTSFVYADTDPRTIPVRPTNRQGNASAIDLDGDGDLDLVFAAVGFNGNAAEGILVGLNNGSGEFEFTNWADANRGTHPTDGTPTAMGIVVADFNRDGMLDLLTGKSNLSGGTGFSALSVVLADQPGRYRSPVDAVLPSGGFGNVVFTMVGDFNNDGIEDLWGPQYQGISITRLGIGDGTFADAINATPYIGNEGLAPGFVADLDHDGNMDIVWLGGGGIQGGPTGRYLAALGNGDGSFQISFSASIAGAFYGSSVVEPGDFNEDGFIDFAARSAGAFGAGPFVELMLNDPLSPGTFQQSSRLPLQSLIDSPTAMTVGDFDGDDRLDVAVLLQQSSNTGTLDLQVFRGDGTGGLFDAGSTRIASTSDLLFPKWMAAGDLNQDGITDIALTAAYSRAAVLLGTGGGSFRAPTVYAAGTFSPANRNLYLVDSNSDHILDLVTVNDNNTNGNIEIRLGLGDGTFGVRTSYASTDYPGFLGIADFDRDGHPDFVMTGNIDYVAATVFSGSRDGLADVLAADFNGDGRTDVLAVNHDNAHIKLLLGDRLGGFERQPDLLVDAGPVALAIADFNGDGRRDFVTANRAGQSLSLMLARPSGGFDRLDLDVDGDPVDVKVADVNGDGNPDLIAIDSLNHSLQVWPSSPSGQFLSRRIIPLGDEPHSLALGDTDRDNTLDVIINLPQSNRLMLLRGDGSGDFVDPIYVATSSPAGGLAAGDINQDGTLDLAVTLPNENRVAILYGIGQRRFAKPQTIAVGELPVSITLEDANRDGRLDLLVTNAGDATASLILNRFDSTQIYRYPAIAVDPDFDPVTYEMVDGPGGMILDSDTGDIRWAPNSDQVGLQQVTLQASDGRGGISTQHFSIAVEPSQKNASPLFTSQASTSIAADTALLYQAHAVDNDNDTLRYRLVSGPVGASVDPLSGDVSWDPRGVAIELNDSVSKGGIRIPNSPSLGLSSFTLEGWFEFDSTSNQILIWKDAPDQYPFDGASYALQYQFGSLKAIIGDGTGQGQDLLSYGWTPVLGQPYHLAATFDATTGSLRILLNGRVVAATTSQKQIVNFDMPLYIGNAQSVPFQGKISQLRVWNDARSEADIAAGMNQQFASGTTNLVADYRFLEGDAQSVFDSTTNGNHGVFYGDRWPTRVEGLAPVSAADFTISVEDGKGGLDIQSFTITVAPLLRGSIQGTVFIDANSDGFKQVTESPLNGWRVFLDTNGNDHREASESFAITDGTGAYRFDNLIEGQYQLAIENRAGYQPIASAIATVVTQTTTTQNVPITTQPLGQLRGQLTEQGSIEPLAHYRVYADLDRDGFLSEGEPFAVTDRLGRYAISGLPADDYLVRVQSPVGWQVNTPTSAAHDVALASDDILDGLDFILSPLDSIAASRPLFVTTPPVMAVARDPYRYAASAITRDTRPIHYSLSLAPSGMVMDSTTGQIVWTPSGSQTGTQQVILRAAIDNSTVGLQEFAIQVAAPNTSPLVTSSPSETAVVGSPWHYRVVAQDAEQVSLHFSLVVAPAGATIDATTGLIEWTASVTDVGVQPFEVEVADNAGGTSTHAFSLNVVSDSISAIPFVILSPRLDASLQSQYLARTGGLDAVGQTLTTELLSGPFSLTLDAAGLIQWQPTASQLGAHTVSVRFHSPSGSTEEHDFTITARQTIRNVAPQILSLPTRFATANQLFSYNVVATDADHDALAYELLSGPGGMSLNPQTGTLRWVPARDQVGGAPVSIRVTDPQGGSATQTFVVTTRLVGGPPAILSTPPTEAAVGSGYLYTVVAVDTEQDPLTYALLESPDGMTINGRTGEIAWTPAANQVGQQLAIISVADGTGGTVTQGFAIRVAPGSPNLAPIISSSPNVFATTGQAYAYTMIATDPEASAVNYALRRGPLGMTIDANTGVIAWTPTVDQVGRVVVTLAAVDVDSGVAVQSFEIDVLGANTAPTIISAPPTSISARATFRYDVLARDTDHDPIRFEFMTSVPPGMTIDPLGRIRWATSIVDIGPQSVTVRATDPRGGEAIQVIDFDVVPDTAAPKVTVIPTPGGWPWDGPIVVFVSAVDNVGVSELELRVNGQLVPLDANHTARLSFADFGVGLLNLVATARDEAGNVGTGMGTSFYRDPEINVESGEGLPTATITSPSEDETVFGMVNITGTAAGNAFKEYRLSYGRADQLSFTELIHSTTEVTDGLLGVWDTTMLENDAYVLRLEVTTNAGNTSVHDAMIGLSGELKLGNFRLSFEDITIPVAGIPITVTRTYDTLRSDRDGDFGFGWRLEYRNTDLRTSLPKSGLEDLGIYTPFKAGAKVYLTLPGGARQGFTFTPEIRVLPGFGRDNDLVLATPRFTPDRGNTSTLFAGSGQLFVNEFGELYASGGIPWNPAAPDFGGGYTLTTADGTSYRIDGASGLMTTARDRNGNTLSFTDGGIDTSSDGSSLIFERDRHGRVIKITDFAGNSIQYGYSRSGDLVRVVDREGYETRMDYSLVRSHFLVSVTDPLGREGSRASYDEGGRVRSITDANGNSIHLDFDPDNSRAIFTDALGAPSVVEYDPRGNAISYVNPLGFQFSSTYDSDNRLTSTQDPLGARYSYSYDAIGNLASTTDPLGFTITTKLNVYGQVESVTDPLGNTLRLEYDRFGNQTAVIDALGRRNEFIYDRAGNVIATIDPLGAKTQASYDARGQLIQFVDAGGRSSSMQYTANGRMKSQSTDGSANWQIEYGVSDRLTNYTIGVLSRELTYDESGRIIGIKSPSGVENAVVSDAAGQFLGFHQEGASGVSQQLDANGNVVEIVDFLGNVTRFAYDAAGQRTSVTHPDGTVESYHYDAVGRIIDTIDPKGNTNRVEYDATGRPVLFLDAEGNSIRYRYDAIGRRISTTDAGGATTRYSYNEVGELVSTIFPDGSILTNTYSKVGMLVSTLDPDGRGMVLNHDATGNISSVLDAAGGRTSYEYDQHGRMTRLVDANSNSTTYEYDTFGRRTAVIDAQDVATRLTYSDSGLLESVTGATGDIVRYAYGQDSLISTITPPDESPIEFRYGADGSSNSALNSYGEVTIERNPLTRLPTRVTEPDGRYLRYEYDEAQRKTLVAAGLANQSEQVTRFSYDSAGRLVSMTDPDGGVTSFSYVADRLILTVQPNGVATERDYDSLGRVTRIMHRDQNGSVIQSFDYRYDRFGNRTEVEYSDGSRDEYAYDNLLRLISESKLDANGQRTDFTRFEYDSVGNRIRTTTLNGVSDYTFNSLNQLIAGNGKTYQYDAAGNLATMQDADGITRYTFNALGQLVQVQEPDNTITSFGYDAFGHRVSQTREGVTTYFLLDRFAPDGLAQVVAESDSAGQLTRSFVNLDSVAQSRDAQGVRYYLTDAIGSTRALVDSSGVESDTYDYTAFGELLSHLGSSSNPYRLNGQRQDETGLYFLRARYYDPTTGRFLSRDPVGGEPVNPVSFAPYTYAANNPINFSDPSGRVTLAELQVAIQQQATLRAQQLNNFRKGVSQTSEQIADASRYFGGVLALVAVLEVADDLPNALLFFGATAPIGILNTGRIGFDLLGSRKATFHFFDAEWAKIKAQNSGSTDEYIALAAAKKDRSTSPQVDIALLPGFFVANSKPRPLVPIAADGIAGTPSMSGILVHEFSHITVDALDDAYEAGNLVGRNPYGFLVSKLTNPAINADNYRVFVRAETIGYHPLFNFDILNTNIKRYFG